MLDNLWTNPKPAWSLIRTLALSGLVSGCGATLNDGSHLIAATSPPAQTDDHAGYAGDAHLRNLPAARQDAHEAVKLAEVSDPGSEAYKIGPMDVLEISVFQVPELSKTVQVGADGTINLPLAGSIHAAGQTPGEIERDLTARLGRRYLQSPQVNVYLKEYNSQRITVDGAVKRPGVYPLRGPATLLQVLATAEGFTDTADPTVVIFRTENGVRTAAKFDVSSIRSGNAKDPQIVQGDVVVVSTSTMKESYQALLKILPVSSLFVSIL